MKYPLNFLRPGKGGPVAGLVLAAIAVVLAVPAVAQSPFALTNVGQQADPGDARMAGRGGWGMAVVDTINPGFLNPAGLAAVHGVTVQYTHFGTRYVSTDDSGERTRHRVMTPGMRLALPVSKGRLAVHSGFVVDRSFRSHSKVDNTWYVWGDTLQGNEQFLRSGSLFQVPFGASWRPLEGLSLGTSMALVRGSLTEKLYQIFTEPTNGTGSPLYQSTLEMKEHEFHGTCYEFSGLWEPRAGFRVGASYTPAYDVDVAYDLSAGGVGVIFTDDWTLTLPDRYTFGIQGALSDRWRVGGDYRLQEYNAFVGPAVWTSEWVSTDMEDETTVSFGLERVPAYERRGGWNNLPVRLGFRSHRWAYRVGGEPVDEWAVSAGTGFPFRGRRGALDVALSYGRIGDRDKNGLEDKYLRLTVSVTGIEKWW